MVHEEIDPAFSTNPKRSPHLRGNASLGRLRHRKRTRLRLCLEQLESRHLLAGGLDSTWSWFQSFEDVQRIAPGDLSAETRVDSTTEIGPHDLVASEWIVQLTDRATGSVSSIESIDEMVDRDPVDFTVIAGLGSPGSVLLRGRGVSEADVREALSLSSDIESFSANALVQGQASPNESEFNSGLLSGLNRIGASTAWDESRGSSSIVVGVVDSGIDPAHGDLYLNIWINQGELPTKYLDDDGDKLVDIDGDGRITFYDLNNVTVSPNSPYTTTQGGFALGPNASFVRDLNNNGRIDAIDLLEDANWSDGRDTDNNGFFDDFFGVNFRAGAGDPFADNNPSDELGHGTHVAGTIGAIGNNDTGVVGVNWRTSLMSLRILDNNNQGDSGAAIRAVNYARQMRERYRTDDTGRVTEGANVRVLNNSWGQPGGFEVSLEAAIRDSGDAGILFVAASGNGNILGNGVDNDRTPFYPASYDSPNVIAVAASDSQDRVASFSNFGVESVDVLAPGIGIRSTLPGGGYGSANGTSMASPHVAGTAALIWSAFPEATLDEVRQAIVSTVDPVTRGDEIVSTGGRLNVAQAINANVFAPAARVIARETITRSTTTSGETTTEFTVEYSHRNGIDITTIGNDDLIVTRQWGPAVEIPVTLKPNSITPTADGVSATYIVDAPGSGSFSSTLPVAIENAFPLPKVFTNNAAVSIDSGPPNTLTSQLIVDNILSPVSNLVVSLDIDHTFDADLTATLIAPDGTRAVLFSSVGGVADNFTGTVLDDSAATSITAGSAPFTGSFRPQASITPLAAAAANGTWTLEIADGSTKDGGSLRNWSLSFLETPTATSQILVKDVSEGVADFTVSVDIEHASVGDLAATLIAPDGSRAVLFANVGGTSDNFMGTIFDDTAATSISVGSAPFTGTFTPQENLAPLGGSGPNGIWTLELENGSLFGNAQLLEWSLNFSGSWDPLDFGDYVISTVADNVSSREGAKNESREIGSFNVRINDSSVIYVDTFADVIGNGSLRDAIIAANAASPAERTIVLESGTYRIDIPVEIDPTSTFGTSLDALGIDNPGGWSNATTGDFDVDGKITIVGDTNDDTVIDAQGLDRVFKVYPAASLNLARLTVQGGVSPTTQGGGGILSVGELDLQQVIARKNNALGADGGPAIFGGAIAAWGGTTSLNESWLTENQADFGGGIYYGGEAAGVVQRSTLSDNEGGGLYSFSSEDISVANSTFSANSGGYGAIANGIRGNYLRANNTSRTPTLSADGRYVTFSSEASNLVTGDNNGNQDIFVYDRTTGTIERVSVSDAGVEGNGFSQSPSLSADGRYVTFDSFASNLVTGDNNGAQDIFVYDRTTGTIERVSVSDAGVEGNGPSSSPALSADGRYVTFDSFANNLVPGDNDGERDVFVYDRTTRTIERVSVSDAEVEGNGASLFPMLNADGRYVTFVALASNLVPGDNNGETDIFVYDRTTGTIERVSVSDAGVEGNGSSGSPALSADGRYVTFSSRASNLVPGDNERESDVFVYDRTTRTIERVSVSGTGDEGNNFSGSPSLSADGRYVTFSSRASNLVPRDQNGMLDIFVYDRIIRTIVLVSVSDAGVEGYGFSQSPSLSANGRYVTFSSSANNLVPGDNNLKSDIFVYDRTTRTIEPITYRAPRSVIDVDHATIAFSLEFSTNPAVIGDVDVRDSLFAANEATADIDSRTASFSGTNIHFVVSESNLIAPLQRLGNLPPVHPLIAGNPAIDAADPSGDGTRDQLGTIRVRADIGAVEATTASVRGIVYADRNQNGLRDPDEPGISGVPVAVTGTTQSTAISNADNPNTPLINEEGVLNIEGLTPDEYQFAVQTATGWSVYVPPLTMIPSQSSAGNGASFSPSLNADGRYVTFYSPASNLVLGDNNGTFDVFVYDRTTGMIERVSVSDAGVEGNGSSFSPSLSAEGRYVAFTSFASNLVTGDNNGKSDIFIYDRITRMIERVSVDDVGVRANGLGVSPSLSADGRYVTFESTASNLVPGDNNSSADIFVYDRVTGTIERVSVSDAGVEGNDRSLSPSLSADGRYVTFYSRASNLVLGDNNGSFDVFVYDRTTGTIERVSVSDTGVEGNSSSFRPSLSADGRYVAFTSFATNLVTGDNNGSSDVFVYDRTTGTIERVSVSDTGVGGSSFSDSPSLSGDGRYVTFRSHASNLVPGDNNGKQDIFVYDRISGVIVRVSVSDAGVEGNNLSTSPSLSADGRDVTFLSRATNLVPGDDSGREDVFLTINPLAPRGVTRDLRAGEIYTELNIGLVPDPGTISGKVFEDIVSNGIFDENEPALENSITVFLDINSNGILDEEEPSVATDADGNYEFLDIDAFRSYEVAVQVPIGFEQVTPGVSDGFVWDVFLPAGGTIRDRDFGFRRVASTGQSSQSAVSGRLYDDRNGNGVFDDGVDVPLVNREVYLDATNFGIRDSNEPRVLTDSEGRYSIDGLSSRTVAVSTTLDETLVHVSPLGSDFSLEKFSLFDTVTPFANPQAIAAGDFNADGFEDVAVALGEGNLLSIRLNDGAGGFLPDEIDIDLGEGGTGPTSLVVGQFDADSRLDVALTANFSSNVIVLLNFDSVSKTFASRATVPVGQEPIDLVAGQFGGDAAIDLVVVNKGNGAVSGDETLQVLTNNGSGVFTAGPAIPTGGNGSVSIVAGDFAGDASLDVAVIHAGPLTTASPFGGVTVLAGNGAGGLTLEPSYYEVGALPIDSVSADFDGDGRADLAVANFSSNSISVLLGQTGGTFRVQTAILGTASGAFDIAVADIDNDGDVDVIASNLEDRNISIFRNIGIDVATGDVRFEPLENIGLGQFALAQRMPLVVANFDNDSSGPGGSGTIDIVTIPQQTDTLHVLTNRLVNGTRRVELTGTNRVSGLDFIIQPAVLRPSLDPISDPRLIVENAPSQTITLTGIAKGRPGGPPLQVMATSSDSSLIPNPTVDHLPGASTATLVYTPNMNASGDTTITVTIRDAGADQIFGTADDAEIRQSFVVGVLATVSQSIILEGSGNTFFLSQPNSQLDGIQLIDIRGSGDNTLMLDADRIRTAFTGGEILVISDSGDEVVFDDGWDFEEAFLRGGQLVRRFVHSGAVLNLTGPDDFTNPTSVFDVNASGSVTSVDALQVINELSRRLFSDSSTSPAGAIRDIDSVDLTKFRFYDVSRDSRVTALDALQVINQLARQSVSSGEGAEAQQSSLSATLVDTAIQTLWK